MGNLLASLLDKDLWWALPLVLVISLVYGATRHELPGAILNHALRAGAWIVGFVAVIFVILFAVSSFT